MKNKKLYIIAGEASGDLHGANLVKALLEKAPGLNIRAWGGDLMEAAGAKIVKHYKELAFMGFAEVVMNLKTILNNLKNCKEDIEQFQPDALILIDYPGFNLRIAKWAKKKNIKVFYYISPQIWAWKQSRVHAIKRDVDHMFTILPFEKDFYAKFDFDVAFVGHPLLDAVENFREQKQTFEAFVKNNHLSNKPIVAVLPGSRKQEISTMLPIMLSAVEKHPDYQFVIAAAPSLGREFYQPFIEGNNNIDLVMDKTYNLLNNSTAALVTSGTATLETALFEVPEVVCYKGNTISYLIAKNLIKVDYISLVNLVMDREIVKELIQAELNPKTLDSELSKVLPGGESRELMLKNYQLLKQMLGGKGASKKTAEMMLKTLNATS